MEMGMGKAKENEENRRAGALHIGHAASKREGASRPARGTMLARATGAEAGLGAWSTVGEGNNRLGPVLCLAAGLLLLGLEA